MLNKERKEKGIKERTKEEDFKSYSFKGFKWNITANELGQMYDSDEFFKNVNFNEEFIKCIEEIFDTFNWVLVTKGSKINHQKKMELIFNHPFFNKYKDKIGYYGLSMKEEKSTIYMMDGIQVDDMIDNLKNTDAIIKVLFKNDSDTEQNRVNKLRLNMENLYVINTPNELVSFFMFLKDCEENKIDFNFFEGME